MSKFNNDKKCKCGDNCSCRQNEPSSKDALENAARIIGNAIGNKISADEALDMIEANINGCPDFVQKVSNSIPACSSVIDSFDSMNLIYGPSGDKAPSWLKEEIMQDDTAMTNVELRGTEEYYPSNFEDKLPDPIRAGALIERRNNTHLIDALMDINELATEEKMKIQAKAISDMYRIDAAAKEVAYRTLLEYNTQAGMHREADVMCRIIEDFEPKKPQ